MNSQEWSEAYEKARKSLPQPGALLRPFGAEYARLDLSLEEGKPPFLYGRCFIPTTVGVPPGWYLQPVDSKNCHGIKCILMPKSRQRLLREHGVMKSIIPIRSLTIVKRSRSGDSFLVDAESI